MNEQCKYAYGAGDGGELGLFKESLKEVLTAKKSMHRWIQKCREYCEHYPGYQVMLKAIKKKSWKKEIAVQVEEVKFRLVNAFEEARKIKYGAQSDPDNCRIMEGVKRIMEGAGQCEVKWNDFEHIYAIMVRIEEEGRATTAQERFNMYARYKQKCGCKDIPREVAISKATPKEKLALGKFAALEQTAHVYHLLKSAINRAETYTWSRKRLPNAIDNAKDALKMMKAFLDKIKAYDIEEEEITEDPLATGVDQLYRPKAPNLKDQLDAVRERL